jgi:hypothetical protein
MSKKISSPLLLNESRCNKVAAAAHKKVIEQIQNVIPLNNQNHAYIFSTLFIIMIKEKRDYGYQKYDIF